VVKCTHGFFGGRAEEFSMNRIVIATAAAISLLATGAMAADLAPKPYVKRGWVERKRSP
jgi:hypothetical protein